MGWSWKFNLGVGFLLWLAALAVLAQVPALDRSSPVVQPVAPSAVQVDADELQARWVRATADHAHTLAYTQVRSSQRALRQCR